MVRTRGDLSDYDVLNRALSTVPGRFKDPVRVNDLKNIFGDEVIYPVYSTDFYYLYIEELSNYLLGNYTSCILILSRLFEELLVRVLICHWYCCGPYAGNVAAVLGVANSNLKRKTLGSITNIPELKVIYPSFIVENLRDFNTVIRNPLGHFKTVASRYHFFQRAHTEITPPPGEPIEAIELLKIYALDTNLLLLNMLELTNSFPYRKELSRICAVVGYTGS